MSDMKIAAKRVTALNDMDSADEIASFFRRQGVKGARHSLTRCPIAAYVKGEVPIKVRLGTAEQDCTICVSEDDIVIYHHLEERIQVDAYFPPGPSVVSFIRRFDAGEYPDLVEEDRP